MESYHVPADVQTINERKKQGNVHKRTRRRKIGVLVVLGGDASKYLQAKTDSLGCTKKCKTKKSTNEVEPCEEKYNPNKKKPTASHI